MKDAAKACTDDHNRDDDKHARRGAYMSMTVSVKVTVKDEKMLVLRMMNKGQTSTIRFVV